MSQCKFSNLIFGDHVTIHATGTANCVECGTDARKELDGRGAIYQGHSGDMDLFIFDTPYTCPSCGIFVNGYGEVCGEAGGLNASILLVKSVESK